MTDERNVNANSGVASMCLSQWSNGALRFVCKRAKDHNELHWGLCVGIEARWTDDEALPNRFGSRAAQTEDQ